MNDDLDALAGKSEQMMGLDHLETLVHHGGAVDRDLGAHRPIGMLHRLGWRHRRHGGKRTLAEGAAAGGEHDALDGMRLIALEDLEDGIVLAVDRQEAGAVALRFRRHERAGADQGLLVGERNQGAPPHCRQRGGEPRRADDRRHHPVRRTGRRLDHGVGAGGDLDAASLEQRLQRPVAALIGDDGELGIERAGLLGQALDALLRHQRFDLIGREARCHQLDGVAADRAGRAQNGDPTLHP